MLRFTVALALAMMVVATLLVVLVGFGRGNGATAEFPDAVRIDALDEEQRRALEDEAGSAAFDPAVQAPP